MMLRMNLLDESIGEMKEVCVMGYFGDSFHTSTKYAECHDDEIGYFAAPISKLYVNKNTVKDVMDMCESMRKKQEELCGILDKVVNKGE